jgi:hypothetical protein
MRLISITLILSHLLLIWQPAIAFQQKNPDMEIRLVRQDALIGNKGRNHGVAVGTFYDIHQNGVIIGTAEVKVVKESMCGLKITTVNKKYDPKTGDLLILSEQFNSEQESIFSEMQDLEFTPEKLKNVDKPQKQITTDYYLAGKQAADDDYGSAFGGGMVAGLLGGLIGWGIGYAIISGQDADVPPHYLTELDQNERLQFRSGYKDKIKSKRKRTFNAGAFFGTLVIVAVVLASSNSD